jgi:hypothetical protein
VRKNLHATVIGIGAVVLPGCPVGRGAIVGRRSGHPGPTRACDRCRRSARIIRYRGEARLKDEIAAAHRLPLVEDAAAPLAMKFGGAAKGRRSVARTANAACFSFHRREVLTQAKVA